MRETEEKVGCRVDLNAGHDCGQYEANVCPLRKKPNCARECTSNFNINQTEPAALSLVWWPSLTVRTNQQSTMVATGVPTFIFFMFVYRPDRKMPRSFTTIFFILLFGFI
ncbi:hypothetical protein GWI33_001458 [Rhynchophorus ferrugineus]|uniref:Uncharacterized protein n=1 Tax=Rhynchophorus ferrugineus TaxID=354439 RepID=A0A834IY41_RHYFE|nr:hypothetical protein GWI33_001458 [Rhynchophorus ferrugineus]